MTDPISGFGEPGNVLRVVSEADLQILNAAGQHVAERYGCMVTIGDDPPDFCGSGTLVRIGEETFVATAKHLFKGLDSSAQACFWWGRENEHEGVRIGEIRWPSADIDVAAARLTKKPEHAAPPEKLDLGPADDGSELWIVSGISQGGVDPDFQTKTLSVVWWTLGLCPLPRERWPNLARLPSPDRDLFAHYSNRYALNQHGKAMSAIDPHGLSGGGMWAVRNANEELWTPDAATRLIGIQRSTSAGGKWSWLRGTKVREWLKVLLDNWANVAPAVTQTLQGT